jgi:hypothetical protein
VTGYSVDDKEAHAILDGALVVATGGEMLKTIIDRVTDPASAPAPLADDSAWKTRAAASSAASAWAVARMDRLREIDPDRFKPDDPDAGALFLFGPWIQSLQQAPWIAADLTFNADRFELNVATPRVEAVYNDAVAGYVPAEGQGAAPPIQVPGLIASGSLWRNLAAVWEQRGTLFPPEAQNGFAQLDSFAGQFFGGRDFGTDVLGAFGNDWQIVVARQDPATLNPKPDLLLPAFALVVTLNPDDPDFNNRLKAAYQSFIGLANLGAAQQKAPPLMLGSEECEGVTIATARYLPPRDLPEDEPVDQRFNFSPSTVQVGDRFVIASTAALARDLVKALNEPAATPAADATPSTLTLVASGAELGRLVAANRERLIADNMVKKGNDRGKAEGEIDLLQALVDYLGQAQLRISDTREALRATLRFDLAQP